MRSCAFIKGLRVVGKISLMDERMRRILLLGDPKLIQSQRGKDFALNSKSRMS